MTIPAHMLVIPGWVIPADINSKSLAKAGITVDIIIICFYSQRQAGNHPPHFTA